MTRDQMVRECDRLKQVLKRYEEADPEVRPNSRPGLRQRIAELETKIADRSL